MKFEFAKYTDVTNHAKKLSKEVGFDEYNIYQKILLCPDTHDAWVAKIQVGVNEEFELDENKVIIERNKIDGMGARHVVISHDGYLQKVLLADMDDGGNWDVYEYDSIEEALEDLDGGFGIIEED